MKTSVNTNNIESKNQSVYVTVSNGIVQDVFPDRDTAIKDMRRHVYNILVGCCGGKVEGDGETCCVVSYQGKERNDICMVVPFDPNNRDHREAYEAQRDIWNLPELAPLESTSEIKRFGKMFIYRLYIKWKWMQQRFERIGDMDRAADCFYHRLRLTKLYIYQPGWRIMDYGDMKPIFFPRQRIK